MNFVANDLRKTNAPSHIIEQLLKQAEAGGTDAIIESIRAIGELDLLKEKAKNFYLFAIDADIKTRYERIVKRGSSTDNVSFEKFVENENKEMDAKEAWNMNIRTCMSRADFLFSNNLTREDLHKQIDEVLGKIKP